MRAFRTAMLVGVAFLLSCKKSTTEVVVVTSMTMSAETLTITTLGATGTLTVTVIGEAGALANPSVTWTSSNTAVATVAGNSVTGTVTAVGTGTAQITASAGGKTSSAQLTVATVRALSIDGAGDGTGTISSLPAGISCTITSGVKSGTCTFDFTAGSSVSLAATPASSHVFVAWSGVCTGRNTCAVTLDQPKSVIATFANPCATILPYTLGTSVNGSVSVLSCPVGGTPVAQYQYTVAAQSAHILHAGSTQFTAILSPVVTSGDFWFTFAPAVGADAVANVIAAPGTYRAFIGSDDAPTFGNFTLSSTANAVFDCEDLDVSTGVSFNATLSASCEATTLPNISGMVYARLVFLVAPAGRVLTVRMNSTAFSPAMVQFDGDGFLVRSTATDPVGPAATISFTPTATQAIGLVLASRGTLAMGAYTLTIDPTTTTTAFGVVSLPGSVPLVNFQSPGRAWMKPALAFMRR